MGSSSKMKKFMLALAAVGAIALTTPAHARVTNGVKAPAVESNKVAVDACVPRKIHGEWRCVRNYSYAPRYHARRHYHEQKPHYVYKRRHYAQRYNYAPQQQYYAAQPQYTYAQPQQQYYVQQQAVAQPYAYAVTTYYYTQQQQQYVYAQPQQQYYAAQPQYTYAQPQYSYAKPRYYGLGVRTHLDLGIGFTTQPYHKHHHHHH
jgi:hypothetical protein